MRYSFNTLNHSVIFGFPPTLPTQIRLAADAGYDAVGLDIPSVAAHAAEGVPPADIVAALSRHGIGCYEMAALRVSSESEESRRDADAAAAMAGELGAAVVYAIADEAPSPALVDNLRYAADALAAHGIRLGLEFVAGWGVGTFATARDVAAAVDRDVGIVFDTWQWMHGTDPLDDVRSLDPARIAMLQIADTGPPSGEGLWHDMSHTREMPGDGVDGQLSEVCRAVLATGFDGTVSVEVLSQPWRAAPIEEFVATSLAAAKAVCARAAEDEEAGR